MDYFDNCQMKSEAYNLDCLAAMREMADNAYSLAVVDPPYGIKRFEKPAGTTRFNGHAMMQETGLTWDCKPTDEYFTELFRVSKNQIIWGANNFTLPASEYFLIWNKQQTVTNFASAEYAWVSPSLRQPAMVFNYGIHQHNQTNKIHPTQKPVALYKWILTNYAKPGDTILDTHLGSGSSRIAAHDLGFDFTGYELDADYFTAQEERFANHIAQVTLFEAPRVVETQAGLF